MCKKHRINGLTATKPLPHPSPGPSMTLYISELAKEGKKILQLSQRTLDKIHFILKGKIMRNAGEMYPFLVDLYEGPP